MMGLKIGYYLAPLFLAPLFAPVVSSAASFGLVTDAAGNVTIARGVETIIADLGVSVSVGDTLSLPEGSLVVIVSYAECEEFGATGPAGVSIGDGAVTASGSKLSPRRKLPVCYEPEEFGKGTQSVMGGFILRSADPVAALRRETESGNASSTTLMTLIMHDLKSGRKDLAKPNFEELKRRAPGSAFVIKMDKVFNSAE